MRQVRRVGEHLADGRLLAEDGPAFDVETARVARSNMGSDVKMAPQDRQAFMTGQQAQRQEAFASVKLAAGTLLAVLDDTQKAKAKDALPGLAAQSPGMMRHGMMGGQGTHGGMPGAGKH